MPYANLQTVPEGLVTTFKFCKRSYYFKIPFDVKAIVSVAKNELIDRGQS